MTTEPILETLQLDVSRDGLFQALRAQFTSTTTFLPELMQNARRAGASRVLIEWDEAREVLIVTDDGGGIHQFRDLVVAYQSGWDREIKRRESPWGVGLFAALYASEEITVHSLDRRMVLDERCFANGAIYVTAAPARQGTEVQLRLKECLRRSTQQWLKLVTDLAKGFPIAVHFNGVPLARPHALDSGLAFRKTEIGDVYLQGWEDCQPRTLVPMPVLYCQGLPLRRLRNSTSERDVLHVDTTRFEARMPDRDVLLNPDVSEPAILQALEGQWRGRLRERQTEVPALGFVDQYWRMCAAFKARHLLIGMPVAPSMLSRYIAAQEAIDCDEVEVLEAWGERELPSESTPLMQDCGYDYDGRQSGLPAPLASIYGMALELAVLDSYVPEIHPGWQRTVDLLDASLGLAYELNEPGQARAFFGEWITCHVQTCESYTIRCHPTPDCTIPESLLSYLKDVTINQYSFFDPKQRRLIVPAGDPSPGRVVRQVSTFCDEHDCFQEEALEADWEAVKRIVASMRANSPAAYLEALLAQVMPDPAALGDQAFQVRYDAPGRRWTAQSLCEALESTEPAADTSGAAASLTE